MSNAPTGQHISVDSSNIDGYIVRQIEQAPSEDSMIRELIKNGIEAIQSTQFDLGKKTSRNRRKLIHITKADPAWFGFSGYSGDKFCILNTGNGMSEIELMKHINLNSSGSNKKQGMHGNYGIGAKVSTLGVNRAGVIWASCHNGKVNVVLVKKHVDQVTGNEFYGPMFLQDTHVVADITYLFESENPLGVDTSENWTALILCGNDMLQDTTTNPYDKSDAESNGWCSREFERRFANVSSDITINVDYPYHARGPSQGTQVLKTMPEHLQTLAKNNSDAIQYECVVSGELKIHYYWDGKVEGQTDSRSLAIGRSQGRTPIFSAIQYKDEFYDVRGGGNTRDWKPAAKQCGINYGAEYVRVYVELPETGNFIPNQYRSHIMIDNAAKTQVELTSYAAEIYNNIPAWLKARMEKFKPQAPDLSDVEKSLQETLNRLMIKQNADKIMSTTNSKSGVSGKTGPGFGGKGQVEKADADGRRSGGGENGTNNAVAKQAGTPTFMPNPNGAFLMDRKFPTIMVLRSQEEINNVSAVCDSFSYKAAEMVSGPGGDILYINGTYGAIRDITSSLIDSVDPKYSNEAMVYETAYKTAIDSITVSVGTGLVFGLAKRGSIGYSDEDFLKVTDPASLSTHADAWIHNQQQITSEFKKTIRPIITALELSETTVDSNMSDVFNLA